MDCVELSHLTFAYGKYKKILLDISFKALENETIGIIGANGVGKSTLLKLIVGLLPDYSGEIKVRNTLVSKSTLTKIREKVGYVFQDSESQLFMSTVYNDVAFAPRNYGYSKEEVDKRVVDALKLVHIEELKESQIYRLSGGQKKLASIATILSMQPEIILLDEPTVALDPKNRRNLIHILNSIKALKMIATHDLDFALDTCSRIVLLSEGKIIKDGTASEILYDKELLEQYGLELPLSLSRR